MFGSGDAHLAREWDRDEVEKSKDPEIVRLRDLLRDRPKNEIERWNANPVLVKAMGYYLNAVGQEAALKVEEAACVVSDALSKNRRKITDSLRQKGGSSHDFADLMNNPSFVRFISHLSYNPLLAVADRASTFRRLALSRGLANIGSSKVSGIMVGVLRASSGGSAFAHLPTAGETEHVFYYEFPDGTFKPNDVDAIGSFDIQTRGPQFADGEVVLRGEDIAHILTISKIAHGTGRPLKDFTFWFNPNVYPDGSPSPYATPEYLAFKRDHSSVEYDEEHQPHRLEDPVMI